MLCNTTVHYNTHRTRPRLHSVDRRPTWTERQKRQSLAQWTRHTQQPAATSTHNRHDNTLSCTHSNHSTYIIPNDRMEPAA